MALTKLNSSAPITSNTDTPGAAGQSAAGDLTLSAFGTFTTGTLAFFWSPDDGTTWHPIAGGSFTAIGFVQFKLPVGARIKATTTGVTTDSLNAGIGALPQH
jgi:hypothetical protein